MKNILIISQVRMGSSRLSGKLLKEVLGKPMLWYFIKRIEQIKNKNKFILAIANSELDKPLIDFANNLHLEYHVGSEHDVLDRTYQTAKQFKGDIIVRLTSDMPLSDPEIIDKGLNAFLKEKCDYLSNDYPASYPEGFDFEIFTFEALETAWKEAKDPSEREHITPYFSNHPEKFIKKNIRYPIDLSSLSFELDTYEDFLFLSQIIKNFHDNWLNFKMIDVISYLKQNPELLKINNQYNKHNIKLLKTINID